MNRRERCKTEKGNGYVFCALEVINLSDVAACYVRTFILFYRLISNGGVCALNTGL